MLSTETRMLAKNAVLKVETLKPLISEATSKIMSALITRTNRPRVSSVNGKVRINIRGLIKAFANPSTSADAIRDVTLSNFRPLNMKLAAQSEIVVIPQ